MRGNIKHEKILLQKFYFDMALDLTLGILILLSNFLIIVLSDYLFPYIYFDFYVQQSGISRKEYFVKVAESGIIRRKR